MHRDAKMRGMACRKKDSTQLIDSDDARMKDDRAALIAAAAFAATCAIGALRSTDSWAKFLAHPLVDPDITINGAALFRIMLIITAVVAVAGTLGLIGLSRRTALLTLHNQNGGQRTRLYGLIGLIALGFAIRAMRINESLWYDEIASWRTYNGGTTSFGAVIGAFLDPINHTFHTLLNRLSVQWLVGEVGIEIAFRLPALLFSLATIPVMFGLGQAAANERVGWFAACIAAVAPVCVLEGVEARGYSMMIFFSTAATWALIEAFRRRSPLLWLLYAICCALGVWSQFVTAWIAIGHGAWLAWRFIRVSDDRMASTQGLIALTMAGVISIMLHAPMIPGLLAWRENFVAARPDQPRIFGAEGLHALMQLGGAWTWKASLFGLGLAVTGAFGALRRRTPNADRIPRRDVLAMSLLGALLMLLTVAISGTWLYARFLLFVMPGAMLLMAFGLDEAWSRYRLAGAAAIVGLLSTSMIDLALLPPKQPLRDAMDYVQTRHQPGDRIVVVGLAHDVLSIYMHADDLTLIDSFMFGRDLEAKLDSIRPQWVIIEYPDHVPVDRYELLAARGYRRDPHPRFDGWADWGHGDVVIYSRSDVR